MKAVLSQSPPLKHLERLTTSVGLFEHSLLHEPRIEHGYCVDDVARALVLLSREPQLDDPAKEMLNTYLQFTLAAVASDGRCHNRMNLDGIWTDSPGSGDWWGRAAWGLGFAAVYAPEADQRTAALRGITLLSQKFSPDLRATAFAALGAGEILLANPDNDPARKILVEFRNRVSHQISPNWYWPEPRLGYGNASIAEATIIAGLALDDSSTTKRGIKMLEFLLSVETRGDHFSPTPVGGRGPGDDDIRFDQQPIEIAAIADACARAWQIDKDPRWINELERAWRWFLGENDVGVMMFDPKTGAGYDGLHAHGPNLNQGAESTIAMLSTAQHFYSNERE